MDVSNKDAFSFCATLANIFGNAKIEANNPKLAETRLHTGAYAS